VTGESDKKTHFGRAGEYFAMSELLLRGWNVAVPVVDVGDDVFIIDDNDKTTHRIQVKARSGEREGKTDPRSSGCRSASRASNCGSLNRSNCSSSFWRASKAAGAS
jgi:hypothetical protein